MLLYVIALLSLSVGLSTQEKYVQVLAQFKSLSCDFTGYTFMTAYMKSSGECSCYSTSLWYGCDGLNMCRGRVSGNFVSVECFVTGEGCSPFSDSVFSGYINGTVGTCHEANVSSYPRGPVFPVAYTFAFVDKVNMVGLQIAMIVVVPVIAISLVTVLIWYVRRKIIRGKACRSLISDPEKTPMRNQET